MPYDLAAASRYLERPSARLYTYHFLRRLKPKALNVMARFPYEPAHLSPERVRSARSFAEFDRCVTAPLHGFDSAEDYYDRSSAIRYLPQVAIPTLCISAEDDPMIPAGDLARLASGETSVTEPVKPFRMSLPAIPSISKYWKTPAWWRAGTMRNGGRADSLRVQLKNATEWLEQYRRYSEESLDRLDDYLCELQWKEKRWPQKVALPVDQPCFCS